MLQTGRSRVRVPMRWIFFNWPNSSSRTYGPRVDSASNRNEYQEDSWVVKRGRRVRPTTLPPSVSRLPRRCGSLNLSHPHGPSRPVTGIALLTFTLQNQYCGMLNNFNTCAFLGTWDVQAVFSFPPSVLQRLRCSCSDRSNSTPRLLKSL
jgi:hypothetical protein